VNLIEAGANYGWPIVTGAAADERFSDPVVVFPGADRHHGVLRRR